MSLAFSDPYQCAGGDDYVVVKPEPPLEQMAADIEEDTSLGAKQTAGKLPVELLPWPAIMEIVRVLEFGAQKYDDWNWVKGVPYMSLLASTMRHVIKFICGEDIDDESGLPHTAHAMTNLMFLTHFHMMGMGAKLDNRPKALANGMKAVTEPDAELWSKYVNVMNIGK